MHFPSLCIFPVDAFQLIKLVPCAHCHSTGLITKVFIIFIIKGLCQEPIQVCLPAPHTCDGASACGTYTRTERT